MTIWRPKSHIRVIAIGLHWREGKLLACEVPDDKGTVKGVRPLGGGVEFGECWQDALRREFREELDVDILIKSDAQVFENIYDHHGATGHEIVFAADIDFPSGAYEDCEQIEFHEDSGMACRARWFDLSTLSEDGQGDDLPLYPTGLKANIARNRMREGG